jgi:RND superfamily putative drug exporter
MNVFFTALGRFVVRFRYAVIVAWIVFGGFCLVALPSLNSVIKTQTIDFLPGSSPSRKAVELQSRFTAEKTDLASLTLVAAARSGTLSGADGIAISNFEDKIRGFPHVTSVQDLSISRDGRARQAQILAGVPTIGGGTADALVRQIRATFPNSQSNVAYHLTGDLPITYDTVQQSKSSENLARNLSYLFIIVLLLVAFRSLLAPIVMLITAGAALVISGPVIAESTHLGVPVSSITPIMQVALLLGAGTDYCVFLVSRMREEMANGLSSRDAVARAIATVGESISFSAFTVIVALMVLLLAETGVYQSFGPPLAIGIGLTLVAGLTLLPALLAVFGRAVFWPTRPSTRSAHHEGRWARVAERAVAYPWATLAVGVVIFGGLALGGVGASTTGGFTAGAPAGTDSGAGQSALIAHFPAASASPELAVFGFRSFLWLDSSPAMVAQRQLASNRVFRSVVGPFGPGGFDPPTIARLYNGLGPPQALPTQEPRSINLSPAVYNAYRSLAQFFTADGTTAQFYTTPRHNDSKSTVAINSVPSLRSAVTAAAHRVGAAESGLVGVLPVAYDVSQTSNSDLNRIIPIVALLIAVLLAIVLRSLVAPAFLVVSVVLSYLATIGLAAIVFVRLGSQPTLEFVLPIIVFTFLMALGADYNILVMSRIREEAHSLPIVPAVKRAIGSTGTAVTTAGLILGGTFAAFGLAAPGGEAGNQMHQIGYGIAAGILLDTFLVRTLLVPTTVVLLGRRTWWPSRLWKHEIREPREELELVKPGSYPGPRGHNRLESMWS